MLLRTNTGFSRKILLGVSILLINTRLNADWLAQYQSAEKKLLIGKADEAQRDLRAALSEAQSSSVSGDPLGAILDALGRAQFRTGRYREATVSFERSLPFWTQSSSRIPALCNAVQAYRELGDYSKAEKYSREAIALDAANPRAWQLLGSVLIKRRRYADAEAALRRALLTNDHAIAASAWRNLAVLYEAQRRYEESAQSLQHSLELSGPGQDRARILANLGSVEQRLRRLEPCLLHFSQASAEMETAVGSDHPDLARILESYSLALKKAGRRAEAAQANRRANEIWSFRHAKVDWRDLN